MIYLFLKLNILIMLVKKVFKKQMKVFAVEMMETYAESTDNDIDDELVARIKKAMKLGAV